MDIFSLLVTIVILQRIGELFIAKQNENWMKSKGATEYGKEHYKYIVLMHTMFFVTLIFEVRLLEKPLSPIWPLLMLIFLLTQALRVWSLLSLGRFWNTKIIILPEANVVEKGPYRFIRHPNYLVVAIEIVVLPLLFNAYFTAILFSVLNAFILSIRIPAEEQALRETTNYSDTMIARSRFSFIRK